MFTALGCLLLFSGCVVGARVSHQGSKEFLDNLFTGMGSCSLGWSVRALSSSSPCTFPVRMSMCVLRGNSLFPSFCISEDALLEAARINNVSEVKR